MTTDSITVTGVVPARPEDVYAAWLDGPRHTAFTGAEATVDPTPGGRFTAWDGYIEGVNETLDAPVRIVQRWRTAQFPADAPHSRLELRFEAAEGGTRVVIDHSEIPAGQGVLYQSGWVEHYFTPMQKHFGERA